MMSSRWANRRASHGAIARDETLREELPTVGSPHVDQDNLVDRYRSPPQL